VSLHKSLPGEAPARGLAGRIALVLVAALLLAGALLWLRRPHPAQFEYLVFGTRARIELLARNDDDAEAAQRDIGRLFVYDHRTWHPWEPSELTRLNDALAKDHSYRVPADVADMIRRAQSGFVQSDGLFNAAAGRLIGLWGFHTSRYPVQALAPSPEQVDALLAAHPGMNDIHIGMDGTVSTANSAVSLDLNGLAEGYAAAQVRHLLIRHDIHDALIYIGGFVLATGRHGDQPWRVGVSAPSGVLGSVALGDGEALSSSGDYQRHRASSSDLGHIVDTRTGWPQRASAAASVISDDPVLADMAATALMVAGPQGFQRLADHMQLNCALLLGHDGVLYITPGMLGRLHMDAEAPITHTIARPASGCRSNEGQRQDVVLPTGF
jgi:FAD:protein FMN transferase